MNIVVVCPHCKDYVEIEQVNCGIFRHAQYKSGEPVNPHASRAELESASIWGCGGPFRLQDNTAVICDYI